MLVEAVVVAEDRAGADVGALTHAPVADIRKVVGLRPCLETGVLDLDEIADVSALADVGAGAEAGKGADPGTLADPPSGTNRALYTDLTTAASLRSSRR